MYTCLEDGSNIFAAFFEADPDGKPFDRKFFDPESTSAGPKIFSELGLKIIEAKKGNKAIALFDDLCVCDKINNNTKEYFERRAATKKESKI